MRLRSIVLLLLSGFFACCDNPFSPRGPFSPRLVVYSVLSNSRTSQFVRVYSTYNPPELNPYEYMEDSAVSGVNVLIRGGGTHVFRDTLLRRQNSNGGDSVIAAFTSEQFPIVHGTTYALEVSSPSLGVARSTVTAPTPSSFRFAPTANAVLDRPNPAALEIRGPNRNMNFSVGLSTLAKNYLVRMFIEFEVLQGTDTLRGRWQVPLYVSDTSFSDAIYPAPSYADRAGFEVTYPETSYVRTLARIVYQYTILVTFKRVVFEIVQIGESLHNYSSIINGFQDELSLRVDQPDYSNIAGGFGLFGIFVVDEFSRPFPSNFFFNPAPP